MRVLIVDDSKAMRMIVKRALRQTAIAVHAEIVEAATVEEALEQIRSGPFDAVLSDWNMPGQSGFDLLATLTAEGLSVPFGFVTSESTFEVHERAFASGARFVVTKPFTPASLQQALAAIS